MTARQTATAAPHHQTAAPKPQQGAMTARRALSLLLTAVAAAAVLHASGPTLPAPPLADPRQLEGWWEGLGMAGAVLSVARVGGLAFCCYLTLIGLLGTVAALTRWRWTLALSTWMMMPALRRALAGGSLALALASPGTASAASPSVYSVTDLGAADAYRPPVTSIVNVPDGPAPNHRAPSGSARLPHAPPSPARYTDAPSVPAAHPGRTEHPDRDPARRTGAPSVPAAHRGTDPAAHRVTDPAAHRVTDPAAHRVTDLGESTRNPARNPGTLLSETARIPIRGPEAPAGSARYQVADTGRATNPPGHSTTDTGTTPIGPSANPTHDRSTTRTGAGNHQAVPGESATTESRPEAADRDAARTGDDPPAGARRQQTSDHGHTTANDGARTYRHSTQNTLAGSDHSPATTNDEAHMHQQAGWNTLAGSDHSPATTNDEAHMHQQAGWNTLAGSDHSPATTDDEAVTDDRGDRASQRSAAERRAEGDAGAATTAADQSPVTVGADAWLVKPGDHLWGIASATVTQRGGSGDHMELVRYWLKLIEANIDTIGDDPDRIHPGQIIRLPD